MRKRNERFINRSIIFQDFVLIKKLKSLIMLRIGSLNETMNLPEHRYYILKDSVM